MTQLKSLRCDVVVCSDEANSKSKKNQSDFLKEPKKKQRNFADGQTNVNTKLQCNGKWQ